MTPAQSILALLEVVNAVEDLADADARHHIGTPAWTAAYRALLHEFATFVRFTAAGIAPAWQVADAPAAELDDEVDLPF